MLSNTKDGFQTDMKNAERKAKKEGFDVVRDANEVQDDIVAAANKAGRKMRRYYDAAYDEIHDDYEQVTTRIRSNPVQSSLIALGVGVLLGAVLRRL